MRAALFAPDALARLVLQLFLLRLMADGHASQCSAGIIVVPAQYSEYMEQYLVGLVDEDYSVQGDMPHCAEP